MMPTKPVEPGKKPPSVLEKIVLLLTPRSKREEVMDDLRDLYESSPGDLRYAREAAKSVPVLMVGRARAVAACNATLLIVQTGALYASFAGAPWSFTLAFALLLGLVVLLLRDGHRYPAETPAEAFVDAVLAVAFVVISLILIALLSQTEILPGRVIVRGTLTSLVALSLLRMIFRKPQSDTGNGPREAAEQSYRAACWMNAIWAVAWIALILSNEDAPVPYLDLVFGSLPILIAGMTYRHGQEGLSRPRKSDAPAAILRNHERDELIRKRSLLWVPAGIAAEILFATVIVAEFFVAVVFSSAVDWVLVGTNFTASLMLFVVWMHIRKANRDSAGLLQAEIDQLAVGKP